MCVISIEGQTGFPIDIISAHEKLFRHLPFFGINWAKLTAAQLSSCVMLLFSSCLQWRLIPGVKLYKKQDYGVDIFLGVCVCLILSLSGRPSLETQAWGLLAGNTIDQLQSGQKMSTALDDDNWKVFMHCWHLNICEGPQVIRTRHSLRVLPSDVTFIFVPE